VSIEAGNGARHVSNRKRNEAYVSQENADTKGDVPLYAVLALVRPWPSRLGCRGR
jgi:hypothetical protein